MRGDWDKFRKVNSEAGGGRGGGGERKLLLFVWGFFPTIFPSVTVHSLQYRAT